MRWSLTASLLASGRTLQEARSISDRIKLGACISSIDKMLSMRRQLRWA